jgi:hypothetical protein
MTKAQIYDNLVEQELHLFIKRSQPELSDIEISERLMNLAAEMQQSVC